MGQPDQPSKPTVPMESWQVIATSLLLALFWPITICLLALHILLKLGNGDREPKDPIWENDIIKCELIAMAIVCGVWYWKNAGNSVPNSNMPLYNRPQQSRRLGTCTGASNCRVCTNCTACAYCSRGGTCGVCRP